MSRYDLIAFDMDGTLLDSAKQVRPDSLTAIAEAVRRGKTVALSTGRSLPELEALLQVLTDVRYVVAISGGLVYDAHTHEILHTSPLPHETVLALLDRLQGEDVMLHLHSLQSYVDREKQTRMADYSMAVYQTLFDTATVRVADVPACYREKQFPVYKFNIYCRSTAQRAVLEQRLSDLPLNMVHSEIASLECSAPGISKAEGLRQLCGHLGTTLAHCIAVGDSDNDRAMLEAAGLSIAMGNSVNSIRSLCDVVVRDNDHGGCAQAIYEYLLRE